MSIIVDSNTRLLVQGITGHAGRFHSGAMKDYGTRVLAGVSPGKGGGEVNGIPVYNTVREAVSEHDLNTSIVFVPARFAADAVYEAVDGGIETIVIVTEHIPFHDSMKFIHYARMNGVRILGPNCPGAASPGKALVGIMSPTIFAPGNIGVASRSGTLTYEIVNSITEAGLGESTTVGLGGDPVTGTSFVEALEMFENDPETEGVVLVGEIGGTAEEDAAEFIEGMSKPVYAYIAGRSAPPGKRMGHAGAIIARGKGTAESKVKALTDAGVKVAGFPSEIPGLLLQDFKKALRQ